MKLSARKILPGTVIEIAGAELGPTVGTRASAVIEASDVMVGTDG
ncbi:MULTISPECIES: hypothetical protein [Paracoccus]|jgi:molybdopterin-binding protein|nr:hypothetical protein [Paracoccus sp. (in: a-proteobacteria)]